MCNDTMIDSIGNKLKAINHIMQRKMFQTAADAGIDRVTIMHGWIIGYLYCHQEIDVYQRDIESNFAISRSTVTNILKLMEKKGYIIRQSVDTDARLKKIVLTEKGKLINSKIEKAIEENENRFNSVLTSDERQQFIYLVRKLRHGLESN